MRVLLVDNYDSFTFNLFHLLQDKVSVVDVVRNDKIDFDKVNQYDKIVLSPDPGLPSESSLLKPLIKNYASKKSMLGICLGHQAIGEVFGCKLLKMSEVNKLDSSAIKQKISEYRKELFELNLQKNTTSVEKPHLLKTLKRDIARLLTVLNTKEASK